MASRLPTLGASEATGGPAETVVVNTSPGTSPPTSCARPAVSAPTTVAPV